MLAIHFFCQRKILHFLTTFYPLSQQHTVFFPQKCRIQIAQILPNYLSAIVTEDFPYWPWRIENHCEVRFFDWALNSTCVLTKKVFGKQGRLSVFFFLYFPAQIPDVLFQISQIAVPQNDLFEIKVKNRIKGRTSIVNLPLFCFKCFDFNKILNLLVWHVSYFLNSGELLGQGTPFFVLGFDIVNNDFIDDNKIFFESNGSANSDNFMFSIF